MNTTTTQPPKVYLAGKIKKNGWRNEIFPELHGAWIGICMESAEEEPEPILLERYGMPFIYTGPFMVSCDHGCFHGPGTHGIVGGSEDPTRRSPRENYTVFRRCINGIHQSDFVFAHIDSNDAFGTLLEIGFAYGRKKVFVNFATEELWREVWFAGCAANYLTVCSCPELAFRHFLKAFSI